MTRTAILDQVSALLAERLPLDPGDGPLDEGLGLLGQGVGLDSVEVLQLVAAIEERFAITVDDDDLVPDHFHTVGALVSFIEARLG